MYTCAFFVMHTNALYVFIKCMYMYVHLSFITHSVYMHVQHVCVYMYTYLHCVYTCTCDVYVMCV